MPHCRNRQKSHTLHSRSAGNYIPVPTYFSGSLAFQCSVPCQQIHSFRVPIITVPGIHFTFANFKTLGMKYQGKQIIVIIIIITVLPKFKGDFLSRKYVCEDEDPIGRFYTRLLTDRQTDKCQVRHNFFCRDNNCHYVLRHVLSCSAVCTPG